MSTSFPPFIHMFSTRGFRRALSACFLLLPAAHASLLQSSGEAILSAQSAQSADTDGTLYRVFLRDGSTLLSYGEFARVADRIVMSIPLGGTTTGPDLHLLSIPADSVDWEKTDGYADAVRASRYAGPRC